MGYVEREPKTKTGRRKIVLTRVVLEALKEHLERQQQAQTKAGEKWREQGLIFCSIYGGFYDADNVQSISALVFASKNHICKEVLDKSSHINYNKGIVKAEE